MGIEKRRKQIPERERERERDPRSRVCACGGNAMQYTDAALVFFFLLILFF